ncbi:MAG: hypothetical protein BGO23_11265 [Solirubrobacterales bacterium 67-14]|nr:MAG: hypothetical protein BGO23_11265 [Solirubrobacterales bacterium 67-14]
MSEVTPGDVCQARTVLKGTEISSFEVKILDVVGTGVAGFGDLIYFEIIDPDVAEVGVAEGMSGSPILCSIGGQDKVVGAISYGYPGIGPKGFATPITDMLEGQPSARAASSRAAVPTYKGRKLDPLTAPLTVTGVPQQSRNAFRKRLEDRGFTSVVFSNHVAADLPAESADLAPGGSFAMNYTYGAVGISAMCTISYRDGDDFWGCGHPLDLSGQRSLSFSGAYVYDVVGSAWGVAPSFKLGAPTSTQLGSVLYDGPYAVSGRFGLQAPTIPVKVNLEFDGESTSLTSHVSREDELPGGSPVGISFTSEAAIGMAVQAQFSRGGQPTLQNGRICMKQRIIGANREVKACSRVAMSGPAWLYSMLGVPTGAATPTDFLVGGLGGLLTQVKYKTLYAGALTVDLTLETGAGLRNILSLRPVGKVRVGQTARLRMISADEEGKRYRQLLKVKVPRKVKVRGSVRPVRAGKIEFRVASGAFDSPSFSDGSYFASDNDRSAYLRFVGDIWSGRGSIRSPRELDEAISKVFHQKAKLKMLLPWSRKVITFPLRGGGDILVGDASRELRLLPAPNHPIGLTPSGGSSGGSVR